MANSKPDDLDLPSEVSVTLRLSAKHIVFLRATRSAKHLPTAPIDVACQKFVQDLLDEVADAHAKLQAPGGMERLKQLLIGLTRR